MALSIQNGFSLKTCVSQKSAAQRGRAVVPVRAAQQTAVPNSSNGSWQQKAAAAAAAAAAAVLIGTPAAFAEPPPRVPTVGETQADYAKQLQDAVKDRGQQLQELTEYPTTEEQKSPLDQPFQNKLGAGNSSKDAAPLFQLQEALPGQSANPNEQLEQALPDFFKPKPPSSPPAGNPPSGPDSAASAVKKTADKLPSPPAQIPNPATAAKTAAAKAPAAVQKPAAAAKQAASPSEKKVDPKEAAAANNGKLLIGGVLALGLTLWYTIEKKADPSLGGSTSTGSSSSSNGSSSAASPPPASSKSGSGPNKEEDPFFQNVRERTK